MMVYKGAGRGPDTTAWLVLGALGLGGIYLLSKMGEGSASNISPVVEDGVHKFQDLDSPSMSVASTFRVSLAEKPVLVCQLPTVSYMGPDVDTFTYFRILQRQPNGEMWTVYGSGVAGIHLYGSMSLRRDVLVSSSQPQPPECSQPGEIDARTLCAFPFPGPAPTPICGAPPRPGAADAYLEVYGRRDAADADGFSSPSCAEWWKGRGGPGFRRPFIRKIWANKILFV